MFVRIEAGSELTSRSWQSEDAAADLIVQRCQELITLREYSSKLDRKKRLSGETQVKYLQRSQFSWLSYD